MDDADPRLVELGAHGGGTSRLDDDDVRLVVVGQGPQGRARDREHAERLVVAPFADLGARAALLEVLVSY